jgi:hypothetical protein
LCLTKSAQNKSNFNELLTAFFLLVLASASFAQQPTPGGAPDTKVGAVAPAAPRETDAFPPLPSTLKTTVKYFMNYGVGREKQVEVFLHFTKQNGVSGEGEYTRTNNQARDGCDGKYTDAPMKYKWSDDKTTLNIMVREGDMCERRLVLVKSNEPGHDFAFRNGKETLYFDAVRP